MKRKVLIISLVLSITFLLSGCIWVERCCDEVWLDLYISDAVVYNSGDRYQAIYAEIRGTRVYNHGSFLLEEDTEYRLEYVYEKNGYRHYERIYLVLDEDTTITIRGDELRIETYY